MEAKRTSEVVNEANRELLTITIDFMTKIFFD
jgi:hypothetical protein